MEIRWLGHSCFEFSDGDARVVVDPFLKPNSPTAPVTAEEIEPTHILLTHGHADHVADAVGLATRTGAPVVAIVELAKWLDARGVEQTYDPNLGGIVEFDWGWVKLVQAFHTNTTPGEGDEPFSAETGTSIGIPAGLVINIGGVTVYHLGDTCLFGDMKLIAERTPVDVACVPIGGHYTMGIDDAAYACGLIGAADGAADALRDVPGDRGRPGGVQDEGRGVDLVEGRPPGARSDPRGLTGQHEPAAGAAPGGATPCNRSVPSPRGASLNPEREIVPIVRRQDRSERSPIDVTSGSEVILDPGHSLSRVEWDVESGRHEPPIGA